MGSDSKDKKKKPYLSPTVTTLTPEQAKRLVAERTHRDDQQAAKFLESLRQRQPQKEEKHPPNDAAKEKRQRCA
jgi:hypothetical protein